MLLDPLICGLSFFVRDVSPGHPTMLPGTRNDQSKRDSDLLVSLSKASRMLKSCTSEELKDTLCGLAVATTSIAEHGDGDGYKSNKDDGESSYMESLVRLLQAHSKAVQYAAGKTLLALSDSLRRMSTAAWTPFLSYLWTVVKDWASVPSSLRGQCLPAKARCEQTSRTETATKNLELGPLERDQSKLVGDSLGWKNLSAASNAVDLLRRILKACLKNSGGTLLDLRTFLTLFMENITVLATSACTEQSLSNGSQSPAKIEMLAKEDRCITPTGGPRELFLGSLLRLICTAAHVTDSNLHCNADDNAITGQFLDVMEAVIPAVSSPVLGRHINCEGKSFIASYLCHKFLMIMMRLSECFGERPSLALSCCSNLRSFGGGLLGFSLLNSASEADSLVDSPFLASMVRSSQDARAPSVKHLQRRALYILFKIASSVHDWPKPCVVTPEKNGANDQKIDQDKSICSLTCALKQTVSQILIGWLDRQIQAATGVPDLTDTGSIQGCAVLDQLAKSLVELYFDEDDLMLKMLLLLSGQPSLLSALTTSEKPNNSESWKLASMALRPERIFHSFLAAIQFNSSVLIDFLISEDSGALCVLYLMRSIRCCLDSWPEFVKSAPVDYLPDEMKPSLVKPESVRTGGDSNNTILHEQRWTGHQDKSELDTQMVETLVVGKRKRKEAIKENTNESRVNRLKVDWCDSARMSVFVRNSVLRREADCLLQLKLSIERLHRRSLFPYNPSALLRRFDTILDLLEKHLVVQKPTINL